MTVYRENHTAKNILAVILGTIAGILAFIVSSLLLFMTGVLSWTDGGPELPQSNIPLSILLIIVAGSIVGGLTTTLISKTHYLLYSIITGIILLVAWMRINNDFDLSYYDTFDILCILLILPCTVFGAWAGNRIKKKKQSNK